MMNDNEGKRDDELQTNKQWMLLEKGLLASTKEQKRARRWGIFFKMLTFIYLFALLVIFSPKVNWFDHEASDVHTAVIDVTGVIADKESASADNIISSLQAAFHDKNTKGIILKINSPGGSPVQSGYVYDEIKRLRIKYPNIKVYAVISDLGASGAYYIASAADEIYADKASLVGSIGVTATSFGFVKLINMLGIERRVYTSGEHKAFLDPFQPQKEEETNFWQKALDSTHKQFIASVKKGRGDRLKDTDNPQIFSGLIWTGEQALKLGLIDGLGSSEYVAREKIGAKVLVDFTIEDSPFDRVAKKLGASVSDSIMMHLNNSSIPAFH